MSEVKSKFGPGSKKLIISLGVISVVGTLIYFEQIALLYVLATLGLIALLLAVAFSDLEAVGSTEAESGQSEAEESANSNS